MKQFIWNTCIVIIVLALQGCKKEIDIDYKDIAPITVIEGRLTQQGANVRITMTTPMDEPINLTPLTDATVILTDITAGSSQTLTINEQGDYVSLTAGITDHLYELNVKRGTDIYTARCEMPALVEISDIAFNWIKMPYDHVAVLQVTFSDFSPTITSYYWVRLYRNGEAYMWNLVTDLYATDGIINDVFMTSRRDLDEEDEATALYDGDVVSATVTPISREMYDYLEAVSSDSNGPSLFSGSFCLGYFLAAPVSETSIVFRPDSIPDY
ncbi:MAG: DUF4249 domain-containing protein [Muribaculaceae bacterium]|nr:DUF4249 domain-containing protein [Muribaculaceae bacterium]